MRLTLDDSCPCPGSRPHPAKSPAPAAPAPSTKWRRLRRLPQRSIGGPSLGGIIPSGRVGVKALALEEPTAGLRSTARLHLRRAGSGPPRAHTLRRATDPGSAARARRCAPARPSGRSVGTRPPAVAAVLAV